MFSSINRCKYCFQPFKSYNYRVKLECSKEICFNCVQFLKKLNKSICPFCESHSSTINHSVYVSLGYCNTHNTPITHFDKIYSKLICENCINDPFNAITCKKKSEQLDVKLLKKKVQLEDYLKLLNQKKEKLKNFELILNSGEICYKIQNTGDDIEDLETKIKIVKENNLIEYNQKFITFFKESEIISEEYLENNFFKELDGLIASIQNGI